MSCRVGQGVGGGLSHPCDVNPRGGGGLSVGAQHLAGEFEAGQFHHNRGQIEAGGSGFGLLNHRHSGRAVFWRADQNLIAAALRQRVKLNPALVVRIDGSSRNQSTRSSGTRKNGEGSRGVGDWFAVRVLNFC